MSNPPLSHNMVKKTKTKIRKEKGYMLLFWDAKLSKKVFNTKKDAKVELENELEPQHCGSCECDMDPSEVKIIEVEISYKLPSK